MSDLWTKFMNSEYAQKEMKKEAQQFSDGRDRDPLYSVDPGNKTELSKSETTQGVNAGGASMVGSEDRAPLYTTSPAAVPGGQEQYADATVEGLEDIASAMLNVATKAPHANPRGTQDNSAESWDGIAAKGGNIKNFTKQAQEMMMPEGQMMAAPVDEDVELESILAQLEKEEENTSPVEEIFATSKKKKTVALLKQLVRIANELDQSGQSRDASEIDNVIKDEVKELLASQKKTSLK